METTNDLKILGNLSVGTHTRVSIIKAERGFRSLEETLKFILNIFDLVDEEVKKKYMDNYNLSKLKGDISG